MSVWNVKTRRWTRVEYERLIEQGVFRADERLELLGGLLVVREPQGGRHAAAVERANELLRGAFGPGWRVRVQLPVGLDDESEPEPDISVVHGDSMQATRELPGSPVLVVEVADSSLALDRSDKAVLYAGAGVPEYWIVNLVDRVLEVYREPAAVSGTVSACRYGSTTRLRAGDFISPLTAPHARIAVTDLLP